MSAFLCRASPSLALIKYWGKVPGGVNLPATSSIAVSLAALETRTRVEVADGPLSGTVTEDRVEVDGVAQPAEAYRAFFAFARACFGDFPPLVVRSENSFPTAAGLASSSSGLAALAAACAAIAGSRSADPAERARAVDPTGHGADYETMSRVARVGSGSASRAVYGGFTLFAAGADHAEQLAPPDHWPQLRIVVVAVSSGSKPVSSREAMNRAVATSPFFSQWVQTNESLVGPVRRAIEEKDLGTLGEAMRASYLAMFSTMFTSRPPVVYWLPESVALIRLAEDLRHDGLEVYETMDAGPQVKLLCPAHHEGQVVDAVRAVAPRALVISGGVGPGVRVESAS